jgi:hypothetical protein
MFSTISPVLWTAFMAFVLLALAVDLGVFHAGMKPTDFAGFRWIGLATNPNLPAAVFSVSIPIIDS